MSLFVRKIEKNKWMKKDFTFQGVAPADAITNCMKTKDNKLSVWKIHDDCAIEQAVVAIAVSGDHLDTFDIVYFDENELEKKEIFIDSSLGKTAYKDMASNHMDIVELDYTKLGRLSEIIINELVNKRDIRYTIGKLKEILKKAIVEGKIVCEELCPSISKKLA
jgi:hypothetical protein